VYAARNLQTGQHVAIKWMHAHPFASDDPDLLRFLQEARIAGKLDSPHVARVLELERDPETGVPFQVMELLEGEDVRTLLERVGALDPDAMLRIVAQASAGLAAAHAAGVVHRDIKPENLYLARMSDGSLVVKLLDFGVAKIRRTSAQGATGAFTAPQVSITKSGELVGTPLFMAPEQLDGMKHVDRRSDVYSLGVTMYALCTGAPPHAHIQQFVQLVHTLVNVPAPSLSEVAPWVDPQVIAVIEKAMAKNPDDRYPDANALLKALEALLPKGTDLRPEMLKGRRDRGAQEHPGMAKPSALSVTTEKKFNPTKPKPAPPVAGQSFPLRVAVIVIAACLVVVAILLLGR
jgi:serine/threonine protein kinase